MRKKICCYPGCNCLIDNNERYCNKHLIKTEDKPFQNAKRSNEGLYNTSQWRKLRCQVLKEQPYCFYCGVNINETRLSVHHLLPPRGDEFYFFERSNLVSICGSCHNKITNKEIQERKNG
jgi:5-methylcytosine-specific restriction endonuclease McrA